jgi:hypothetical protein
MPKKKQDQPMRRKMLKVFTAFALGLLTLAIVFWFYRRSTEQAYVQGTEPLENFLMQNNFRLYKPSREGSWGVGTIVRFVDGEPSKVIGAETVLNHRA